MLTSYSLSHLQLLNWPLGNSSLEMISEGGNEVLFRASLAEDTLAEDPTTHRANKEVPPFHGYSQAGAAEGGLIYANVSKQLFINTAVLTFDTADQLGRKEDYDELAARGIEQSLPHVAQDISDLPFTSGISLKGKIVIARYGGVFRGLKVSAAQDAGAAGNWHSRLERNCRPPALTMLT